MPRTNEYILATGNGPIKGHTCTSVYDDTYFSFERIPFAQPPVGALRFKAPVPVENWSQVLDCTQKPEKPVQFNAVTNKVEGSEDCLYLNVWVKKLESPKPLPVIVFLFGGGFAKGDPTRDLHGPDYFMMKDVVLVSISYRVGALGFLSLADPAVDVPGNAGLKDQLLGLQWIKENIANFNGDPNNITLFGESAGAASVHFLMLNEKARGLFHKAILQSGNALCNWAIAPLTDLGQRLAHATGFSGTNTDRNVLQHLQQVSPADIIRPYLLTKAENMDDCHFGYGPVVEPYVSNTCILAKQPEELLSTAWSNEIPVIMGGTSFEGLLMYARVQAAPFLLTELKENYEHMLPMAVKRKFDVAKQKELAAKLRDIHFGKKEICMANLLEYCDYASYKTFWHPILRVLKARLSFSTAPTYLYRFDFDSPDFNHQRIKYCGKPSKGVAHVDDHSYIFYGDFSWKLPKQSPEYRTIERMIDMWTLFAANSNPNCMQIEKSCQWMPLSGNDIIKNDALTNTIQCFNIGNELKVIDLPEMEKLLVWESLYDELK